MDIFRKACLFTLLILLVFFYDSHAVQVKCPEMWLQRGQKCYKLLEEYATYAKASDICVHTHGGHLVRIRSQDEQNFVEDYFMDEDAEPPFNIWLGAMRVTEDNEDNAFVWSGGYKMNFTHWYPGEPNNKDGEQFCLALWGRPDDHFASWWDTKCTEKYRVVCEKDLLVTPRSDSSKQSPEDSLGIEYEIRSLYTQISHLQSKRQTYNRIIIVLSAVLFILVLSIGLLYRFGEYSYLRMIIERRRANMFTKFDNPSNNNVSQTTEGTTTS